MHPFGVDMLPPKGSYEELTESEKDAILNENWTKGGFHFLCRTFTDLNTNEEAAWYASKFIQRKIAEIVHDPVTANTLLGPNDFRPELNSMSRLIDQT